MTNILLAHPGTQHAPALARELDRRGMLGEFRTCLALDEHEGLARIASRWPNIPGAKSLRNRIVRGVDAQRIHTAPSHELRAIWQIRRGRDSVEALHERNRRFQEGIPHASLRNADAIIGFDTSSWILAERCAALGKPLWLERTINHPAQWHKAQLTLHQRYPLWQETPVSRLVELVAAEETEHRLAHRILVGSSFVARTLESLGVDPLKIVINPYGVAWEEFETPAADETAPVRKPGSIRFLFAGSMGARKGVPVLLEAWEKLGWGKKEAELWLVGHLPEHQRCLIPDGTGIKLVGRLAKAEMAAIYRQCDCFVLPSFSEGFPLVLLEALAAGLPVITTPNTGAGDLHEHGAADSVALVEAGSVDALVEAMRLWKDGPPGRKVVLAACNKLRDRYSWEAYGDRWAALLDGPLA
jgi:starch synthase